MPQKSNKATILIGVLTLIILVFILFSTIYDQIIAQNEGFFYMLVFGGILVLVYVLTRLLTKLFAISSNNSASVGYAILQILAMIGIGFGFVYLRLQYTSTLPVEETLFYRAASFIDEGSLSGSLDVVTKLLKNPTDYAYAFLLAIVFDFTSVLPEVVVYVNVAIVLLIAVFAAHIAQAIGGRVISLMAFTATLVIPSQAYGVYSYNSVLFFTLILLITLDFYLHIVLVEHYIHPVPHILCDIMFVIAAALLVFTDPIAIIFIFLLLFLHYLLYIRNNWGFFIGSAVGIIAVYILLIVLKANYLGVPVSDVFSYSFSRFNVTADQETGESYEFSELFEALQENIDNQNQTITDNYYFLYKDDGTNISAIQSSWLQLATNLIYMFSLILSISCVVFMFRTKNPKAVPLMLMCIGMVFTTFFKAMVDANGYYVFELLIILGCGGIAYMYEGHHPEQFESMDIWSEEIEEEEEEELSEEEEEELMRRARALVFIGEDDELYEEIKKEEQEALAEALKEREKALAEAEKEKSKKPKKKQDEDKTGETKPKKGEPLESPLPLPKKHVPKKLEFDQDDEDDFEDDEDEYEEDEEFEDEEFDDEDDFGYDEDENDEDDEDDEDEDFGDDEDIDEDDEDIDEETSDDEDPDDDDLDDDLDDDPDDDDIDDDDEPDDDLDDDESDDDLDDDDNLDKYF
ncbi:MAG: hypothetical protein K6G83_14405 [Lachnospiraceae bacterium]|nr:hypothetical protein [Lachnospiraceae bacterium]